MQNGKTIMNKQGLCHLVKNKNVLAFFFFFFFPFNGDGGVLHSIYRYLYIKEITILKLQINIIFFQRMMLLGSYIYIYISIFTIKT